MAVFLTATEKRAMFIRSPEFDGWENELIADCLPKASIKSLPHEHLRAMFMDSFDLSLAVLFAEMESLRDFELLFLALFIFRNSLFPLHTQIAE